MSLTQVFSRSTALRRAKSKQISEDALSSEVRLNANHKYDTLLAQINWVPDRKESVISDTPTLLQSTSWSDATTELGSNLVPNKDERKSELGLRASSVLLREEYLKSDATTSKEPQALRHKDSSSTLHSITSHYDRKKIPLAISQQTSASSIRDSALRKGTPVVVRPSTRESENDRHTMFFKSSRPASKAGSKTLSKLNTTSKDKVTTAQTSISAGPAFPSQDKEHKVGHRRTSSLTPSIPRSHSLTDPLYAKVNVRRPRAGTKYWFDNLDDISDDEEASKEPEWRDSFENFLKAATPSDSIAQSKAGMEVPISMGNFNNVEPILVGTALANTDSSMLAPRLRAATSCSSSSVNTIGRSPVQGRTFGKRLKSKPNPFLSADLNNDSVLHLSSDDEEDWLSHARVPRSRNAVQIRDSIATIATSDSEAEVGTARSVAAKRAIPRSVPNSAQSNSPDGMTRRVPNLSTRTASRLNSFIDDSSSLHQPGSDLLTSFPATPQDSHSNRSSFRESQCFSDSVSVYSTQLVSLTRQEQSLIAAMRLKKAAMRHELTGLAQTPVSRTTGFSTSRLDLTNSESASTHVRDSSVDIAEEIQRIAGGLGINYQKRHSMGRDDTLRRASCTTFDTGTSAPSTYQSRSAYQASPSTRGSGFRESVASGYCLGYTGHSRTGTEGTHIVSLDNLDTIVRRDQIQSEEFINWPYRGWVDADLGVVT